MHKVVINTCYGGFWLSDKAQKWLQEHYNISDFKELPRHDPRLIECIETLEDEADTSYSELTIEEIEDNMYRIEDYDGRERLIVPSEEIYTMIN